MIKTEAGFAGHTVTPGKTLSSEATVVLQALQDPEWDFRTISGIMETTRLSKAKVEKSLAELGEQVRTLPMTKDGNKLFTWRRRKRTLKEFLAELWFFMRKAD